MSFLGLEGLHVLVTGAVGGIGSAIVDEFLAQGCKVTALDLRPNTLPPRPNLHYIHGDISSEASVAACIASATSTFGPLHILAANAGITDESASHNIWDMPTSLWDKIYAVNVRGTFLCIKHFLQSAEASQREAGRELENLAVVVTGSECGKFGQAGHVEYASGKAGLQYGLVRTVKNEIVRLNGAARINAVAPGWVDTPLIAGRLDEPREMWREAQATVPLKKIAKPTDVARAVAFLASHKAAGHISGECLSVDGGMEGRLIWGEDEVLKSEKLLTAPPSSSIPQPITSANTLALSKPKHLIKVLVSVDFDAVSGWLGTGQHPSNNLADYSTGFFAAQVGVPRLLKLFKKLGISEKVTWFIPGHSMESFPEQTKMIVDSGCEIGLHGYCHEGADQMTPTQERDVLEKCIDLATALTGKKPLGYRAPLYQIRESTIALLELHGFLYDTSLTHHDSTPYLLPTPTPSVQAPNFTPKTPASSWMHPLPPPPPPSSKTLVELPCNWYMEDATPLQYYPHTPNSQGYVDVNVIESMWRARFEFLRGEMEDEERSDEFRDEGQAIPKTVIFPLVLHPDTSGLAHVIGMVERVLRWLRGLEGSVVEFERMGDLAGDWKGRHSL